MFEASSTGGSTAGVELLVGAYLLMDRWRSRKELRPYYHGKQCSDEVRLA